ncbi:MAG: hypothetical protein ABL999_06275 [Pyrinomonadaceae bacterium]
MRYSIIVVFITLFSLAGVAVADIPPDPGYKRVSLNLIIQPQEDFSDYRFFVKTGAALNEVKLKKGEQFVVKSQGGGAFYRSGILLAVPTTSLAKLSETANGSELSEMQKAIYDGKVPGSIELLKHTFIRDVPVKDAAGMKDPVFKIEKSEAGLKATPIAGNANEPGVNTTQYSREPKTPLFWATVGGGSLLTLAFILLGARLIRRSKSKTVEFGRSNEVF